MWDSQRRDVCAFSAAIIFVLSVLTYLSAQFGDPVDLLIIIGWDIVWGIAVIAILYDEFQRGRTPR